jgi:predicted transcriptional regulator
MKIQNHLSQNFAVAEPYQGTHLFRKRVLNGEPVVVKDDGKFVGILTLRDMLNNPHNLVIDSYSVKPVIDCNDDYLPVLLLMSQQNFEFLPAMKEGTFQGVVSKTKLLEDFLQNENEANTNDLILELKKELSLKNKFVSIISHDIKKFVHAGAGQPGVTGS